MQPKDLTLQDISLGTTVTFTKIWKESDVHLFAEISGDYNPLHMDEAYASSTTFKKRVVHGLLVGSLCSRLVGMYLPGKKSLYLKQSFSFKKPVFINEEVSVIGQITHISYSTAIVFIKIDILNKKEVVVSGDAVVKIL